MIAYAPAVHAKVTVTFVLFQPAAFGVGRTDAEIDGASIGAVDWACTLDVRPSATMARISLMITSVFSAR